MPAFTIMMEYFTTGKGKSMYPNGDKEIGDGLNTDQFS
jgi:hypothetical protein